MNDKSEVVKIGMGVYPHKGNTADVLFLVGIVIAVQGYFVGDLGFYSDDWWYLHILADAKSQDISGLVSSMLDNKAFIIRPLQGVQLSILYWIFGTNPLGYHVVNALVVALGIVLFHLALNCLMLQRTTAVAVPLVYALLPHYSTTRFWISSFTANLSIVFFFLNLYAGLTYLNAEKGSAQQKVWLFVSSVSVLACVMTYEVVLPLFFVSFFIFWLKSKAPSTVFSLGDKSTSGALLLCNAILLAIGLAYKLLLSERTGGFNDSYVLHVVRIFRATAANDFWTYGVKLPIIVWTIAKYYYNATLFISGVILSSLVLIYLLKIKLVVFSHKDWVKVILIGVVVYIGGYAVFLTTTNFQVSAAGISNRISVAAAIGVAICFVGGSGFLCSFIKDERVRRFSFGLVVAGVSFCGYIINCTLSHFYSDAYAQQLAILKSIYTIAPDLTKSNTVILDGMCPYVGPAPVFDCAWDLSGALALHYDNVIKADVRTRRLTYDKQGVSTYIYTESTKFYPYNKNLIVYNFKKNKLYYLKNFSDATNYFSMVAPVLGECANVLEGEGIRVF